MKLTLTRRNLAHLEEKEGILPEEALDLIYDFCQDIKNEQGKSVDMVSSQDTEALYRRLPWLGRFFLRLAENSEGIIREEDRKKRLKQLSDQVLKTDAMIEASGTAAREEETLLSELNGKLKELEEKKKYEAELISMRESLAGEIAALGQGRVQELESEKEALLQKRKELLTGLEDQEKERRELEQAIAGLKKEVEAAKRKTDSAKAEHKMLVRDQELALRRQQDVNYRISRDNDSYAKKIELLRVREIELNNQQRKLAQDLDEYTNKVSVEEGWLKSLDADQYMKEVQLLTQRYEKIIKLREKLEKDWGSLWALDRFGDYSGRDHIAQVLRQNLSDIGSDLQRYRQDLMEVIELLSSEEVLL